MERGMDFLRAQVNNAVMQHDAFVSSLDRHESQAEDQRYRELCARFRPIMEGHQRMLEAYAERIDAGGAGGGLKKALGKAAGAARDLADAARDSDFLRLVQDITMASAIEDTFKTFREAGKVLGDGELHRMGEECERDHDQYADAANRLVQQMFVEHVRDEEDVPRSATRSVDRSADVERESRL